jgi:hypothetical protein
LAFSVVRNNDHGDAYVPLFCAWVRQGHEAPRLGDVRLDVNAVIRDRSIESNRKRHVDVVLRADFKSQARLFPRCWTIAVSNVGF